MTSWSCSGVFDHPDVLGDALSSLAPNSENLKVSRLATKIPKLIACQKLQNAKIDQTRSPYIFLSDLNLREGLKAKKRVTGLVLAVILSFVGELVHFVAI